MPVDLSYAKSGESRSPDRTLSLAISIRGWSLGWAIFAGEQAYKVGHVHARDHSKGAVVPVYQRIMGVMSTIAKVAVTDQVRVVLGHTEKADGPLWSVPPLLALMLGLVYGDMPTWKEHLGKDVKELHGFATLLLGRKPDHELEVLALGLGAAAAQARRKAALEHVDITMEAVSASEAEPEPAAEAEAE